LAKRKQGSQPAASKEPAAKPRLISSVDKALLALERLGEAGAAGRALARLAAELGLNKGSLHHTLSALRHHGFVEQDNNGNYRLGHGILALADSYLRDDSLRSLIHDGLSTLCFRINEICHLGVLIGEDIVYIDKIVPHGAINTWSTVGWRNPALTTALGRAIISQKYVDFQSFCQQFPTPILKRTARTRSTLTAIWQELMGARERGFSREEQEYVLGTSCIGVAILRGPKVIGAISMTGPSERMDARREQILVRALHDCIGLHLPPGLTLQKPVRRLSRGAKSQTRTLSRLWR
jgi:IclR family acetate operon transcriptional repressor